jgi:hypothetical protein
MDASELRAVMSEVLIEHFEVHAKHHEWIQARIDAEESRRDMFAEIRRAAIQWSVAGLLGGLYYWSKGYFKF